MDWADRLRYRHRRAVRRGHASWMSSEDEWNAAYGRAVLERIEEQGASAGLSDEEKRSKGRPTPLAHAQKTLNTLVRVWGCYGALCVRSQSQTGLAQSNGLHPDCPTPHCCP